MDQYDFMEHKIQITGFKAEINDARQIMKFIKDTSGKCSSGNCIIQLLQARAIAGEKHILQATLQAIKSFEMNNNAAKDLGLEICLRASSQRQISRALKILGIENGKMDICMVAVDCDEDIQKKVGNALGKRNDDVLQADVGVLQEVYEISPQEITSAGNIERVMVERTALLNLEI
ncbi:KEOPS complex subunit Cgi121 [uncultured Methanobacterium sp.]|uniref:KEOPS complex subunit Cgi121 n=1 Tax=uncultured Methanobacterium sp. TaxID=176306 RepID=UPI002AA7D35A|nr:KEOPS complex subunit Cgi121 [uncultured Methanobacterium sp.]